MHEGIDIAVPHGTPVRAVAAGRVIYVDWAGTYGILVRIDHGGGVHKCATPTTHVWKSVPGNGSSRDRSSPERVRRAVPQGLTSILRYE